MIKQSKRSRAQLHKHYSMNSRCGLWHVALLVALLDIGQPHALIAKDGNPDHTRDSNTTISSESKVRDRFKDDSFWKSLTNTEKKILEHFGVNAASMLYRYVRALEATLIEAGVTIGAPLPIEASLLEGQPISRATHSAMLNCMDHTSRALIAKTGSRVLLTLNAKSTHYEDELLKIFANNKALSEAIKKNIRAKILESHHRLDSRSISAALALESVHECYAEPLTKIEAKVNRSSDQQDLNLMEEQAEKLRSEGKHVAAAGILQKLLNIHEKTYGPDHPYVSTSLSKLASLLSDQGQYAAAESLYRRSLAIREKSLGSDHPDVALGLNNLAVLLQDQGRSSVAEPLFRRSLAIWEKAFGPDHLDVAVSLNNIAVLLSEQGQNSAAEPLYRRSLAIRENLLGDDHIYVAESLYGLARLLSDQGRLLAAEPLYRRSLAIREQALGEDHLDTAQSLEGLAILLSKHGQYATAESLFRRVMIIRQKIYGEGHPNAATILYHLASLRSKQGQHRESERFIRQYLAIQIRALGEEHVGVAMLINDLASLLNEKRQYAEAELLVRRSLAIQKKALGEDTKEVAIIMTRLAFLLREQGRYAEAETLLRRSLAIREKVLGQQSTDSAISYNNLALILSDQGQYAAAESFLRRSLSILRQALGEGHPDVATSFDNLASLLSEQGEYTTAERLIRSSLAIRERSFGGENLIVAYTLNSLGLLLGTQEQFVNFVATMHRSLSIQMTWLIRELPFLPDRSRSDQLRQLGGAWEVSFGFVDRYPPAAQLALETRLNRQGLLAEIEQRQALLLNAPGIDREKVDQLQSLTQQLASVSLSADRRTAVREQRDRLQAELYRQNPDLQIQTVTPAAVAKALPADGVLVEFQRYRPFDGRKPKDERWGKPQYIALVLKPNGSISAVPLGPAAAIDATVHKGLGSSADGLADADGIWGQLSQQVLQPLLPHLSGSRQWFLSPDGELNRVPFAALPAPQQPTTPLAQAVQLRLVTTGRELVRLQQPAPSGSSAVVMANPSYDRPGRKTVTAARPDAGSTVSQRRSGDLGSSRWLPLPATEQEGKQVATLLGTRLVGGPAATTTALQRQQGPRVLHVATHGFFIADQEAPPADPLRMVQEQAPQLKALRGEDPQLRSGLVLAGANQPDLDPNDDGYLTAAEAVSLKLKGTELVVLSACSTGQGEVRTGEGVYGLQRSLTVAGARSTLLSLWKVDDAATAEFMVRFYKRLKAGEGRADALAAVQAEFRSGSVRGPKGEDWSTPYHWAAWQLVGDWRPIQGL